MAEKMLKWTLDEALHTLTCKHKESQTKEVFDILEFYQNVDWESLESVEKFGMAYSIQQKLSDLIAGKGKKAGYSGAEIFALMRNKWDALTIDRVWSQKGGERTTLGKKISENLEKVSKEDMDKVPENVKAALRAAGVKGI